MNLMTKTSGSRIHQYRNHGHQEQNKSMVWTRETGTEGLLQVRGQPGLHREFRPAKVTWQDLVSHKQQQNRYTIKNYCSWPLFFQLNVPISSFLVLSPSVCVIWCMYIVPKDECVDCACMHLEVRAHYNCLPLSEVRAGYNDTMSPPIALPLSFLKWYFNEQKACLLGLANCPVSSWVLLSLSVSW